MNLMRNSASEIQFRTYEIKLRNKIARQIDYSLIR